MVQQKDAWTITSVDAKLVSIISQEPIKVGDKHKVPIGFFVPGYRLVPVTAVYKEHYEGPVYDMEVREDHSFALVDCTAKNCEIVYVDDCVTEETCLTPEARAKQLRWFNMAVASGPRAMWTIDPRYGLEVPSGIEWPKDAPYNPTPGDPEGEYAVIVMGPASTPTTSTTRSRRPQVQTPPLSRLLLGPRERLPRPDADQGPVAGGLAYRAAPGDEE